MMAKDSQSNTSNPLLEIIRERLSSGPMPASEFMGLALYHPEYGYYRRGSHRWGYEGKDYYTALDLGPLLGETIACALHRVWLELDRPGVFTVLEPGAGRGWLGRDLLKAATGDFASALRYIHCDDNPAAGEEAQKALCPWLENGQARFIKQYSEMASFVGAVVSNELFDALPAQPWRWDGEKWRREVLVSLAEDGSACADWEVSDPGEAGPWFLDHAEGGLEPEDGSVWVESLSEVLERICNPMKNGVFLTIDYGDSADRLIAKGADLRRYTGHTVDGQWWDSPGHSDLTADVDFTRLTFLLKGLGLDPEPHISLGRWVRANAPLAQWESEWMGLDPRERDARKKNLMQLAFPTGMGDRFKVLSAAK